jgi:hypothetical protein
MFFRLLFVLLYFFIWPLCCLYYFDIRILITPLVSSNSSKLLQFVTFCSTGIRMPIDEILMHTIWIKSCIVTRGNISMFINIKPSWLKASIKMYFNNENLTKKNKLVSGWRINDRGRHGLSILHCIFLTLLFKV